MVNRGRSSGCTMCKQRRVKCDEAKPRCQTCPRLGLRCPGYAQPSGRLLGKRELKFVNHGAGRSHVDAASLTLRRPTPPDTAAPFFLGHYASLGRDMASTRGFFEMIVPAFALQPPDSPLPLTVSVLASEILALWRGDPGSFRTPRGSYGRAISSLRRAVHDPVERQNPATVLAVLVLQTYENASAVYNLRAASSTHHDGAASLLSSAAMTSSTSSCAESPVRAYVRKFMRHTEISVAMRRQKPPRSAAYSWVGAYERTAAPDNSSATLDALGACFAELQAAHARLMAAKCPETKASRPSLSGWLARAAALETALLSWAEDVPSSWVPVRLDSASVGPSIPLYRSACDFYPSCQIASIWNLWRCQRLLLASMKLDLLCSGDQSRLVENGVLASLVECRQTMRDAIDGICYSIPFHLGNRIARSTLPDFTDPNIKLAGQCLEAFTADIRRHVIAQGPWRIMHPLSRLLTLFAERDREGVPGIADIAGSEQRSWLRSQFLRVATLVHLPQVRLCGRGLAESQVFSDASIDDLAKTVRKGAVFMSGP